MSDPDRRSNQQTRSGPDLFDRDQQFDAHGLLRYEVRSAIDTITAVSAVRLGPVPQAHPTPPGFARSKDPNPIDSFGDCGTGGVSLPIAAGPSLTLITSIARPPQSVCSTEGSAMAVR
jgi:hypothetical protein